MNQIKIKGKVNTAICYARVVEEEAIEQIRRMCDYPMAAESSRAVSRAGQMLKLFNAEHEDVLERKPIKLVPVGPTNFDSGLMRAMTSSPNMRMKCSPEQTLSLTTRDDERKSCSALDAPSTDAYRPSTSHRLAILAPFPRWIRRIFMKISGPRSLMRTRSGKRLILDSVTLQLSARITLPPRSTRDTSCNFMFTDEVQP